MPRVLPASLPAALIALATAALLPVAAPALAGKGQSQAGAQSGKSMTAPHVMDAWVRLPAVSGRPAGGYFVAHGTPSADALVAVTSPRAERIELHSMMSENGVMKMRREDSFALPARGTLAFAPGGSHLMLFGLSPDVKPGAKVPLTLRFQSGATVTVEAEARAAAAAIAPKPKASDPAHQH